MPSEARGTAPLFAFALVVEWEKSFLTKQLATMFGDALTAAIEARDAQHAEELARLRAELETSNKAGLACADLCGTLKAENERLRQSHGQACSGALEAIAMKSLMCGERDDALAESRRLSIRLGEAEGLLREAHGQYGMPIGIDERIGAFLAASPESAAPPAKETP